MAEDQVAPATVPMPDASPHALKDFGDWLSPIIVKELRQGMRTKLFTTAFIVIQGMMVLLMLAGLSERQGDSGLLVWFWLMVSATLLLIMPLRGFGALSSEVRLNTMDLISMTRMSAWRITLGKWAALVGQSILLAVAVLPYVVIRYFYGGVNILAELLFLGVVLILSCLLSAIMVGLSAFPNFLVRSICTVVGMIATITLTTGFFGATQNPDLDSGIPFSDLNGAVWIYLGVLGFAIYLMYYFLDMGASRIATEAVNHSTRKRVLGLAVLFIILLIAALVPKVFDATSLYYAAAGFIALLAFDALTETPSGVRSLHMPFIRKGVAGKVAQLFLTPGWITGVFYIVALGVIFFLGESIVNGLEKDSIDEITLHLSFISTLLFPLLVIHLFFPDDADLFPAYFFIQWGVILVGVGLLASSEGLDYPSIMWAGCPLPFVSFLMAADGEHVSGVPLFILSLITFAIILVVCIWRGMPHLRLMRSFEAGQPSNPYTAPEPPESTSET